MNLLRDESVFYRRQLMMSTRNPVFFGSVADVYGKEEEPDDQPLEAETHLLFKPDTRHINQARMVVVVKCEMAGPVTQPIDLPSDNG
ncbi:unnamed protein product, partial [Mesorhabditis spiculigera]